MGRLKLPKTSKTKSKHSFPCFTQRNRRCWLKQEALKTPWNKAILEAVWGRPTFCSPFGVSLLPMAATQNVFPPGWLDSCSWSYQTQSLCPGSSDYQAWPPILQLPEEFRLLSLAFCLPQLPSHPPMPVPFHIQLFTDAAIPVKR